MRQEKSIQKQTKNKSKAWYFNKKNIPLHPISLL